MISAIEGKTTKVEELMLTKEEAFMLEIDEKLDISKITEVYMKSYSRVPVYFKDKNLVLGILMFKNLVRININDIVNKNLRTLNIALRQPLIVSPDISVLEMLNEFRNGRCHMAIVTNNVKEYKELYGLGRHQTVWQKDASNVVKHTMDEKFKGIEILGIITLENIIENLLKLEILDESDFERENRSKKSRESLSKDIVLSLIKKNSLKIGEILKNSQSFNFLGATLNQNPGNQQQKLSGYFSINENEEKKINDPLLG